MNQTTRNIKTLNNRMDARRSTVVAFNKAAKKAAKGKAFRDYEGHTRYPGSKNYALV